MKIMLVDPSSYSLPYDYQYVKASCKFIEVDLFCSQRTNDVSQFVNMKQNNFSYNEIRVSPSITNKVFGVYNYFSFLVKLVFIQSRYKYIHFQWSIFFLLELPFFLILRKKLIFTIHNDVPHGYKGKRYLPYWLISKIAKRIVFVSNFTKTRFENNYGKSNRYFLIQHGLMPISECGKLNAATSVSSKKTLVFWGRVEDYKGVDIFLESLRNYKVEIHGRWSKSLEPLKYELLSKSNIEIVDAYISENDICELICRDEIFILPYKSATQSGVLYTLLAHQCVFICSDVGENYEFLKKHNLQELAFNRDSQESIEKAVNFATQNYSLLKDKMISISKKYSWDLIINKRVIETIYE